MSLPRTDASSRSTTGDATGSGGPGGPAGTAWTRRRFIAASAIASATAVAPWGLPQAQAAERGANAFARSFESPESRYGARFRWWWPCGHVETAEIEREVDAAADAGFGGLEIADVHHSITKGNLDPAGHGWATPPWIAAVKAALARAAERGITLDLSIGPSWPAAVPGVTPDDPAAATELAHGLATVAAGTTYDGPVPEPVTAPKAAARARTLLGVHAARVSAPPSRAGQPSTLERASWVDLSDTVRDGRLTWTAPATGSWILMSYWQRGSAQMPEAGPHSTPDAYVVDHFSAAGTGAVTGFWEQHILDAEMRRLIAAAGNTLFEDSLEIETHATLWTPGMLEEFATRMGYDLTPYLPVVVELKEKYLYNYDVDVFTQVRDDFAQVLSDLYAENHLLPLRSWAHGLGLQLRVQGYGLETDSVHHAALFDQPEGESLGFKNLDDYRAMCGGRDMGGRTILSCEAAAYHGGAYTTTWNKVLQTLGSIYAGGVNQAVLHGFAYADAPGAAWPGFAAFSPYNGAVGFSEAWGPRQPMWEHVTEVAAHLRRTQFALQSGVHRADLAWFRQKGWTATGIGVGWGTSTAIGLGWSYGFITAPLLSLDSAQVRDGRLAPDGPAYGAVIVEGDRFRSNAATLQLDGARELDRLSRAGLPVVFVGDWSNAKVTGLAQPGEDGAVRELVSGMLARGNVRQVALADDLPAALAALGVSRVVEHDQSTLMHVHRFVPESLGAPGTRGGVDVFYLANARHAENRKITRVEQDVWLTPSAAGSVPYRLDTWTGAIEPVASYETSGGRIKVRVGLNPAESTVIALASPQFAPTGTPAGPAVATDADLARWDGPRLVVRSGRSGTLVTTVAGRGTRRTTIPAVPAPLALSRWDLALADWRPGAGPTETDVTERRVTLDPLVPWTSVAGLEDVSGIGRYTTTVELDSSWRGAGAYLELGGVFDTFRVFVNGERVPPTSLLTPRVDLGHRLQVGRNRIEVEVPSTLFNRLRIVTPAVFGASARQSYGLVGPLSLVAYREAEV